MIAGMHWIAHELEIAYYTFITSDPEEQLCQQLNCHATATEVTAVSFDRVVIHIQWPGRRIFCAHNNDATL